MKASINKRIQPFIVGLLAVASLRPLHAQPVGPPPWGTNAIQTTGGVTYLTLSDTLHVYEWIWVGPVTRSGTNLSITASIMRDPGQICIECIDCYHTETNVTVLGALPPGGYRLYVYTPPDSWDPAPNLFLIVSFAVPMDSGPTFTASPGTNANERIINVAGVPSATYVLESSSTLTSWVTIRTNIGAPFTHIVSTSAHPQQFLRVRILSGSTTSQ